MRVAATAADCDAGRYPRPHPKQISDELTFPGQIKVSVVRETRAVQFAV